jgi:hypothetical protein
MTWNHQLVIRGQQVEAAGPTMFLAFPVRVIHLIQTIAFAISAGSPACLLATLMEILSTALDSFYLKFKRLSILAFQADMLAVKC